MAVTRTVAGIDSPASLRAALNGAQYIAGDELATAIESESDARVASEAADVLYHALVALRARGVSLDDVAAALEARQGTTGLDEKAGRGN